MIKTATLSCNILCLLFAGVVIGQTSNFHYKIKSSELKSANFKILYDGKLELALCDKDDLETEITLSNGRIFLDIYQLYYSKCNDPAIGIKPSLIIKGHTLELVDGRTHLSDPTKVLKLKFAATSWGVNTIPFRFRPQFIPFAAPVSGYTPTSPSVVTTSFNLAFSGGTSWGHANITTRAITQWSNTVALFFGPNSASSSGLPQGQTNLALSYGLTYIKARNGIGLLIAIGMDTGLGSQIKTWEYQNKPWIGVGVSTSILK